MVCVYDKHTDVSVQQHYPHHCVPKILFSQQTSKFKSSYANQIHNTIPAYTGLSWPISSLRDCLYTYNLSVNMQNRNPTSAPQCNVDPAGDLNLLVGQEENQRSIRVSSKVLSLASPVLAAMFGPRYLEGHILSEQARFSIPSFPLPEEDPEAMTWFCRALHHQVNADESGLGVGLILKIAALCDKYDASTALSGWTRLWMENLSHSLLQGYNTLSRHSVIVLYTSYVFKSHRTFWLATRDIVHHSSLEDIRHLKDKSRLSIFPNRLLGK